MRSTYIQSFSIVASFLSVSVCLIRRHGFISNIFAVKKNKKNYAALAKYLSKDSLEVVGEYCPHLKSVRYSSSSLFSDGIKWNDEALAISKTMSVLRQLKLSGSVELTQVGVLAILDGCPLLQQCSWLFIGDNLKEMCHGRIENVCIFSIRKVLFFF
ncbi:hypothetical protein P8452_54990 [Trifolium repens]|jgi:hypothetical protein|nr:hypothetical protein P8452_54990 [Trifolium repens]